MQVNKNSSVAPLLTIEMQQGSAKIVASNSWTAANVNALNRLIDDIQASSDQQPRTSIDMRDVRAFDTFGAWQLARLARELNARGSKLEVIGLPAQYAGLFDAVQKSSARASGVYAEPRFAYSGLAGIGDTVVRGWRSLTLLVNMLGAVCAADSRALFRPSTFRFTSMVHHLDRVAWQAVPIVLLITFLIGAIIAQQGFFHFRKFGAEDYVIDMVGILVLREIGVLIVAIMVAGRSGSSYTAELGSMKMREEIDALRTMGFDPVEVLILPRVVALVVALPLLTFIGSMSALYGGELVAWLYGGMSPEIFVARLKEAISITHFKVGMIKAPFMALVIGVVACTEGFKVAGSAESLGLQTTSSVVTSIFLVIVLDGLFAIFFASIGM